MFVVLQGVEGDGVVMFSAVEGKEGRGVVPGVPRRAGVG